MRGASESGDRTCQPGGITGELIRSVFQKDPRGSAGSWMGLGELEQEAMGCWYKSPGQTQRGLG